MSILIKGMEMPGNCLSCILSTYGIWCSVFGEYIGNSLKRLEDCPLIEVPPHGRLIDADAFEKENAYFWNRDFINPKYSETLADLVNAAPTIIEAEGGEP